METIDDSQELQQENEVSYVRFLKGRIRLKRHELPRYWTIIISSIMLLTYFLPFLSWGYYRWNAMFKTDENASDSGFSYLMKLIDLEVEEIPLLGQLVFGFMILLLIGTFVGAVLLLLNGLKVWKPNNTRVIRFISLGLVLMFGLSFLKEGLRMIYIFSADSFDRMFWISEHIESDPFAMINVEFLGVGYWLCLVGSVLLFRGSYAGFWKLSKRPHWGRKSLSFWTPVVIFIFLVHHCSGLMYVGVDTDKLKEELKFIEQMKDNPDDEYIESQTATSVVLMRNGTAVMYTMNKLGGDPDIRKSDMYNSFESVYFAYMKLALVLVPLFALIFVQFFIQSLKEKGRLIITGIQLLLVFILFFFVQGLIEATSSYGLMESYTVTFGIGMYIITLAALVSFGEQVYFFGKKYIPSGESSN